MSMFNQMFHGLKAKMQESADRKKQDQERLRLMRLDAREIERQEFEIEFRKNARIMAIGRARKDAAEKSGMQKQRAENRLRHLSQNGGETRPGIFQRLSEHTQRNIANREENLKRSNALKANAKKMMADKQAQRLQERSSRLARTQSLSTRNTSSLGRLR